MNATLVLLFCVFSVALCSPLQPNCGKRKFEFPGTRIVGGRPAKEGEFPWQVSIGRMSAVTGGITHFCGGTILSSNTILTAAHCLDDEITSRLTVRYNTLHKSQGDYIKVKKAIAHPKYSESGVDYDIAILHLDKPLKNASSICLPVQNDDPTAHKILTVSGWGRLTDSGHNNEQLMAVDVPVVERNSCSKLYSEITKNMFCAGYEQGKKDACQGDSGGPIISIDKNDIATIRGIVSWGYGCAQPHKPGVYTRVGVFVDNFIKANFI